MIVAVAASLSTVLIGSTGAYFTGTATSEVQTATTGSFEPVPSVTAVKADSGRAATVQWTAPADLPAPSSDLTYTVKRNVTDSFGPTSGATTVYEGPALSATDKTGSAPVGLRATQVVGFQRMDANAALINGIPYRWGFAFRINADKTDNRGSVWAGDTGQDPFNTGVLTEMRFTGTSEELIQLAPGRDHICALSVTRKVYCMGFGDAFGQTGLSTTVGATGAYSSTTWRPLEDPRGVFTGKSITQVTSGEYFSCALASDGTVGCWGINDAGQLGSGSTAASLGNPIKVAKADGSDWAALAVDKPTMIAAGASHVCVTKAPPAGAQLTGSAVACWGAASRKQLGSYSTTSFTSEPRDVADPNGALVGITAIAAGTDATCVVNSSTSTNAACWGNGGLLGRASGSSASADSAVPTTVGGTAKGYTSIDLSASHACAVAEGKAVCWGQNLFTKLGTTSTPADSYYLPTAVVDTDNAFAGQQILGVSPGWSHTCAVTKGGSVACWGLGAQYQLGQGASATDGSGNTTTAKPVTILFNGTKLLPLEADLLGVGSGGSLMVARVAGQYYSWGTDPSRNGPMKPTLITGLPSDVIKMTAGDAHWCALTSSGRVLCGGNNVLGQLGDGGTVARTAASDVSDPNGVFTGKRIIDVAAAHYSTCALASDGTIGCWGNGSAGQLTERSSAASPVPLRIGTGAGGVSDYPSLAGAAKPLSLTGGQNHYCARTAVSVVCWGSNSSRQLGRTTNGATPMKVESALFDSGLLSVSAGVFGSCAVKMGGTAYCWGGGVIAGGGQNVSDTYTPVAIPASNVEAVITGHSHACVLTAGNQVPLCWGLNQVAQLGIGSIASNSAPTGPVRVSDTGSQFATNGIAALSLGQSASCSLLWSGRISCWGHGANGLLAQDGATGNLTVPTIALLAAGRAIDGALRCLDGATLTAGTCSLVPTRTYYYEVTYRVAGIEWRGQGRSTVRS